jgi:hypothetical protein
MESLAVQCLRCGSSRIARRTVFQRLETPECPSCGYLGWAPVRDLTEPEKLGRRKRPAAEPRLTSVA